MLIYFNCFSIFTLSSNNLCYCILWCSQMVKGNSRLLNTIVLVPHRKLDEVHTTFTIIYFPSCHSSSGVLSGRQVHIMTGIPETWPSPNVLIMSQLFCLSNRRLLMNVLSQLWSEYTSNHWVMRRLCPQKWLRVCCLGMSCFKRAVCFKLITES